MKKNICVGLLAHVDAGKTTLSEALLYQVGAIRKLGRVDHKNAYFDTDLQERERGITIFSKQAQLKLENTRITLFDTPGHVDFSAEMERTLQVLDYAILVINATDGIQGHTKTLWRLLQHYQIPVFFFINKMDISNLEKEFFMKQLKSQLSDNCVDVSEVEKEIWDNWNQKAEMEDAIQVSAVEIGEILCEEIAMCKEQLLELYMEKETIPLIEIKEAIQKRQLFPCFFGSALQLKGIYELLAGLQVFTKNTEEEKENEGFGGLVYKIGHDIRGMRLTYLKVTSGQLKVKDKIVYDFGEEKVEQIRIYYGEKYEPVDIVHKGEVCALVGLTKTYAGMGLGENQTKTMPVLEPILNYQIFAPQGSNPIELMKNLRQVEEEDPQLHILWKERLQEIHVQLMGQVQREVLERLMLERFGMRITFGPGNIVYKETVAKGVEGVGHFEPLRHYAEVHIWIEPGEPGSGICVSSKCSEDILDLNWQKLIATHILEREHPGVLTGSPITDIKFTILTGKAHVKHTEGGDFRQATYRAIRQGLKTAESILLEPIYTFVLEVPAEQIGRAMTDIRNRYGKFEMPEYRTCEEGDIAILTGTVPVATMQEYGTEVHAYTKGSGRLMLELKGYDVCHNSAEIVEQMGYDSEKDMENPTASVFCAHGAGFLVPWNEVSQYMHLEYVGSPYASVVNKKQGEADGFFYDLEKQAESLRKLAERKEEEKAKKQASSSSWEMDKELQQIYEREFGMQKEDMLEEARKKRAKFSKKKKNTSESGAVCKYDKKGNPIYPKKPILEEYLLVDGYNIIFTWEELRKLANRNMDSAKDKLKDMLCNYQGYTHAHIMVVFDGYRVKGNRGSYETYFELEVVHTKQDETADMYIERKVHEIAGNYKVIVATSDNLEQLTILTQGALRMSAGDLKREMQRVEEESLRMYRERKK